MSEFSFVDLFAGIGGFRIGLTSAGGKAVYSNEWNKYAAQTYQAWFGEKYLSTCDIRTVNPETDIPSHDVLSGGFPCQPFSIAGVSKKNSLGRAHGFSDLEQGNLFFAICDIISAKQPKIVFLENVRNLLSHDGKKTWKVIYETLDLLGYEVKHEIINASYWVPQNRRRVFIVAFRRDYFSEKTINSFKFPTGSGEVKKLGSILEKKAPDKKYMLTDNLWKYLQNYAEEHRSRGNGFGFRLYGPSDTSGTMSARYYKDGAEILIRQPRWRNPRRLTPREAGLLMGFNHGYASAYGFKRGFPQVVSDMQAYKQFGNSVCPMIVEQIGVEIARVLRSQKYQNRRRQ